MAELLLTEECASLYSAVSNIDHERIVITYAHAFRKAIIAFAHSRTLWRGFESNINFLSETLNDEEKVDEFFHTFSSGAENGTRPSGDTYELLLDLISDLESLDQPKMVTNHIKGQTKFDIFDKEDVDDFSCTLSSEEDEVLCLAAKVLSNCRPLPTFTYYGNNRTDGQALFDGSAAGTSGTLIHLACIVNCPFTLSILLVLGADLSGRHSTFRRLPIHEAACSGSLSCLSLLLDLSEQLQKEKNTHHAAIEQNTGTLNPTPMQMLPRLKLILALSRRIKQSTMTPLQASQHLLSSTDDAFESNHMTLLNLTSVPDGHGNTALHWAAFKNSSSCVSRLLQANANNNAKAYPSGWTPLHDAAYSDAADAVRLLLESGADVDARASSGATPLCFAAQEDSPNSASLLLKYGADTAVRCCGAITDVLPVVPSRFSGYTPLHYCAHYDAFNTARLLVESGAEMDVKDLSGRMVLHVSMARGSSAVLKELLQAGVSLSHEEGLWWNIIPRKPIQSNKPWNCITQRSINDCLALLNDACANWDPCRHSLFTPRDRRAVIELLRVGKRIEQMGTGIPLDLWREILSFTKRSWFEPVTAVSISNTDQQSDTHLHYDTLLPRANQDLDTHERRHE